MSYQKVQWGGIIEAQGTRRAIVLGGEERISFFDKLDSPGCVEASPQGPLPDIEAGHVIQQGGRYSEKPRSA